MYIYMFEDGRYGVSHLSPLPQDFVAIEEGILTVLNIGSCYATSKEAVVNNGQLEWVDAKEASNDENEHGEYHFPSYKADWS